MRIVKSAFLDYLLINCSAKRAPAVHTSHQPPTDRMETALYACPRLRGNLRALPFLSSRLTIN